MSPIRILCLTDYYLPGFKAGGPIRTLSNIVERLGEEFHFSFVTRDRDLGDVHPYINVEIDSWQKVKNAETLYLSPLQPL